MYGFTINPCPKFNGRNFKRAYRIKIQLLVFNSIGTVKRKITKIVNLIENSTQNVPYQMAK